MKFSLFCRCWEFFHDIRKLFKSPKQEFSPFISILFSLHSTLFFLRKILFFTRLFSFNFHNSNPLNQKMNFSWVSLDHKVYLTVIILEIYFLSFIIFYSWEYLKAISNGRRRNNKWKWENSTFLRILLTKKIQLNISYSSSNYYSEKLVAIYCVINVVVNAIIQAITLIIRYEKNSNQISMTNLF